MDSLLKQLYVQYSANNVRVPKWLVGVFINIFGPPLLGFRCRHSAALKLLDDQELYNRRIMDVGCGIGAMSLSLSHQKGSAVIAIDLDANRMQFGKELAEKHDVPIEFICGNVFDLGEKYEGYFDGIVCLDVLEHVPQDTELLFQLNRLLKSRGWLVITVPTPYRRITPDIEKAVGHCRNGYTKYRLLNLLTDSGYKIQSAYYLDPLDTIGLFYTVSRRSRITSYLLFPMLYMIFLSTAFANKRAKGSMLIAKVQKS